MKLITDKSPGRYFLAVISKPLTVLWLGGVLVLIVTSVLPQAGLSEIDSGLGKDKIARFIIFALLAFYPVAFFPSIRIGLIISTSIAPLGFLLELFQRYVPGRNFSPGDMIANNVGAVIGILLALVIRFFFRTGYSKHRPKTSAPKTPVMGTENDKPGERGQKDEVSKTPKKSWKSKLTIFLLLLLIGYLALVILLPQEPVQWSPVPTQPSPAKTTYQEKAQTNTRPDHPIRYRPEPDLSGTTLPKAQVSGEDLQVASSPSQGQQPQEDKKPQPESENMVKPEPEPKLILVPDVVEDSPRPFSETGLQASPTESPAEKKRLIHKGENDSHEPATWGFYCQLPQKYRVYIPFCSDLRPGLPRFSSPEMPPVEGKTSGWLR